MPERPSKLNFFEGLHQAEFVVGVISTIANGCEDGRFILIPRSCIFSYRSADNHATKRHRITCGFGRTYAYLRGSNAGHSCHSLKSLDVRVRHVLLSLQMN